MKVLEPTLTLQPAVLPDAIKGLAYSQKLTVEGATAQPIEYLIVGGVLPAGLSLNGDTIEGTPTQSGNFPFTVRANAINSGQVGFASY